MTETTLVHASRVVREATDTADTIAVQGGKIAAVGTFDRLRDQYPDATIERFPNGVITAGLIDGHAHPVWGLEMSRGADLSECETRADVIAALQAEAANVDDDEWVMAWGLIPTALEQDEVTNDVITEALGADRLAYITMFDAHSALVSQPVLDLADITEAQRTVDGGGIVARRDGSGLSGHVLEFSAMDLVLPIVPRPSVPEQAQRLVELLTGMAESGLTEAYVPDARPRDLYAILEHIEAGGELPIRLRISPWCTPDMTAADVHELIAQQGTAGRRWRIDGVKLFIDGTIDGGTAWLEEPDTQGECRFGFWHDPANYAEHVALLHEHRVPTITHAIGDQGVRFVAETLAALPNNGTQHRIDHLEIVADEVIQFIGDHDLTVCVQPTHCTLFTHPEGADTWSKRLGHPRNQQGWKTRSFLEAGVVEALGSDWPVADYDPRGIIADAQLRHPHDRTTKPIHPEQALTAAEALRGFTGYVPKSVGQTGSTLEVGQPADLTVWAADPRAIDPVALPEVEILATCVDGTFVVDRRG